jgi:prephenate dehydrogenase
LALRAANVVGRVTGFDRDRARAERARELGIVDEVAADAKSAAENAEILIVAVPVRAIVQAVAEAQPPAGCLVHDVGSTKARIVREVEAVLEDPCRFVGGHPLAGTENTGPESADRHLFRDRVAFVTPSAKTRPEIVQAAEDLWRAVGARPERIDAVRHDDLMAAVSHLPHAVAYSLTSAIADFGPEAVGLTSGGFRDTTRIASSDPIMWRDIFLDNRAPVAAMLERFEKHFARVRALIEAGDAQGLERELSRIRDERRRILG